MTLKNRKDKKMLAIAIGYGVELVAVILVGIFVGEWVGRKMGSENLGAIIGCFVGFTGWTWKIIRAEASQKP